MICFWKKSSKHALIVILLEMLPPIAKKTSFCITPTWPHQYDTVVYLSTQSKKCFFDFKTNKFHESTVCYFASQLYKFILIPRTAALNALIYAARLHTHSRDIGTGWMCAGFVFQTHPQNSFQWRLTVRRLTPGSECYTPANHCSLLGRQKSSQGPFCKHLQNKRGWSTMAPCLLSHIYLNIKGKHRLHISIAILRCDIK